MDNFFDSSTNEHKQDLNVKCLYQAEEYKGKLDDVSVGYRVQSAHQCVGYCNSSRDSNRQVGRDICHHANCQSYKKQQKKNNPHIYWTKSSTRTSSWYIVTLTICQVGL